MMSEDSPSVIIEIPKAKVISKISTKLLKNLSAPNILKRMKEKHRRKPVKHCFQKYCKLFEKPSPVSNLQREEILLPYIIFTKKQKHDNKRQKLRTHIIEGYKIIEMDLQQRLLVEDPPNEVRTAIDADEDFYNYVNGRSLKRRMPVYKSLQISITDVLRIKAEIGYRNDTILNIEINCRKELETYNKSVKSCMKQAKYFDAFISEDYSKSMAFLGKWDQLKVKLQLKEAELQYFATEQFTIKSRLMGLDYLYHLQQKYGRFLYYLSPPTWRSKNREFAQSVEIEAKGFDLGHSNEEETFKVVFEQMKKQSTNPVHPVLYFKQPHDLMDIFDGIEKHLLHHFDYVTHLNPQKKLQKDVIQYLKSSIIQETAFVSNTIKRFKKYLEFENERCEQLQKKFFSIINGLFYNSVGAPDILKLFAHLEFCYERVHSERQINMDIVSMAKSLETLYTDYCDKLDYIHSDAVKCAVTKALNEERQKFKTAYQALRELRLFNRLERKLQRSHEPVSDKFKHLVRPNIKRTLAGKRNKHISNHEILKKKIENPLSDSEFEYLTLFTDWMEGENPDQYLHRTDDE
ncbi:unnamed protein product [Chilo suppressalis]|uniref:Uncharacterized protein n=1 Tax=Chilo suppressalis TaxID=168631 RepID=A0ABN8AUD3_CHISP|nr:unnamed protein product [Chilo suppressalis]